MAPRAKSKIRQLIELTAAGEGVPTVLGESYTFFTPSNTKQGGYYIVCWVFPSGKRAKPFWICECKGFRYNEKDECGHVNYFKSKMEEGLDKLREDYAKPRAAMLKEVQKNRKVRTKG